jgi:serine/threonine protein kinase
MAMPPALAAYVAEQAAAGLFHAHSLSSPDGKSFGIIHRDVNPSNIMLLRSGAVKLLDFGIAKASAALGKVQTRNAMLKGKLSYMSPEQARCASIDARSDIFSLGVTLWEMLTGKRLFRGPTDFDRVQNVLNAPIVPPSHVRPEVPAALDRIVMRALAREVSGRYETAEEMEGELEAFLRTTPVDSHAMKKLLRELFGGHPTENTLDIPAFDSTVTPAEVLGNGTDSHPTKMERLSGRYAYLDSFSSTMSASGPWRGSADRTSPSIATGASEVSRQSLGGSSTTAAPVARGFPWTWILGGAAAAVAAVMLMSWSGGGWHVPSRASGRSRVGTTDGRSVSAASSGEVVRIEIDTSPSGAKVYDARGLAGTTPLTLTLDASDIPAALRLEHAGFEDLHTEISSRSSGVIFLELKRAAGL